MSVAGRYRARIAAGALVLLAVWEIAVLINSARSAPSVDDWRAVAAVVHREARSGALIVFAPAWVDPIGRMWLGDLMTIDQVARMDAARYTDVWEVSTRGAAAPETAADAPASDRRYGRIRLRHFVRTAPAVTWDLRPQSRLYEVDFAPREGMVIDLDRPGNQRTVSFSNVPLGTELQVYAGLADYRVRSRNGGSALLQVFVDGHEVTRGRLDNDSGWLRLPAAQTNPGLHEVRLVALAQDARGPVQIALCVAAEARVARAR